MELVFEMLNTKQFVPTDLCQKTFKQAGGVIGLGEDCDWIIPDRKRHLSNHHALISYREGTFFLTDYLVRHFEKLVVQGLGLDRHPELLPVYFGNYRRVVYLAQASDQALTT